MGRGVLVPEASGGGVPSKAPNSKEEMVGAGAPWEHRQRALPAWVIGTRGPMRLRTSNLIVACRGRLGPEGFGGGSVRKQGDVHRNRDRPQGEPSLLGAPSSCENSPRVGASSRVSARRVEVQGHSEARR